MMLKNRNIYLVLVLTLLLINLSSASLGSFKQNECVNIRTILNTTAVNISTISSSTTLYISNEAMTKSGLTFNYTFCNTSDPGTYIYDYFDTEGNVYVNDFTITPSGFEINSGQSIGLFGSLILIILIGLMFFFIGSKSENKILKMFFYVFSIIIFVVSILYTVIIIQQTLFGFESILTGIESFWFVMKMLLSAGIVVSIVVIFLIMLKLWRIKRGLQD